MASFHRTQFIDVLESQDWIWGKVEWGVILSRTRYLEAIFNTGKRLKTMKLLMM